MALNLRKSFQCESSPSDLEPENPEFKSSQAPGIHKGKELSELITTVLNSFQHGSNCCGRQELQRLYKIFHLWLQPEKHTKEQMISQLVLEQFIISGHCKDKTTLKEKWESSSRNLEKLMEGPTDNWMKPPELVCVRMQGQAAYFSENMTIGEVIVHLKKQLAAENPTGVNIETPFQTPQDILLETGDEDKEDDCKTTEVNNSIISQGNKTSFPSIIQEQNCPRPEEGDVSFENQYNTRRARQGTFKSREGSLKEPSFREVPMEVGPGLFSRPNQSSPEPASTHQSNEGNSTCEVHREKLHGAPKLYKCEECSKSFRYLSHCLAHQRRHKNERPFVCPECQKAFYQASDLRAHQKIHTGEKAFTCSMCGKSFNHKTNLLAHERIHTGEKPYTCSLCQRSYRQSSTYHRHLRNHQKIRLQSIPSTSEASSSNVSL